MKIHICIPAYQNMVHVTLFGSLLDLILETKQKGDEVSFSHISTSLIAFNRNFLMEGAKDADYVLMWDADIQILDRQFIYRMIDNLKKKRAKLSGLVVRMKSSDFSKPVYCCGFIKDGKYARLGEIPKSPTYVDFVGAGVTLLDNKWIRENIQEPFYEVIDIKGPTMVPEDWNLCAKIKAKDGNIIIDPSIKTIHYGQYGWQ